MAKYLLLPVTVISLTWSDSPVIRSTTDSLISHISNADQMLNHGMKVTYKINVHHQYKNTYVVRKEVHWDVTVYSPVSLFKSRNSIGCVCPNPGTLTSTPGALDVFRVVLLYTILHKRNKCYNLSQRKTRKCILSRLLLFKYTRASDNLIQRCLT